MGWQPHRHSVDMWLVEFLEEQGLNTPQMSDFFQNNVSVEGNTRVYTLFGRRCTKTQGLWRRWLLARLRDLQAQIEDGWLLDHLYISKAVTMTEIVINKPLDDSAISAHRYIHDPEQCTETPVVQFFLEGDLCDDVEMLVGVTKPWLVRKTPFCIPQQQ